MLIEEKALQKLQVNKDKLDFKGGHKTANASILTTTKHSGYENNCDSRHCDVINEYDYVQIRQTIPATVEEYSIYNGRCSEYFHYVTTKIFKRMKSSRCQGNTSRIPNWITFLLVFISVILMTPSPSSADYYTDYVSLIIRNNTKSACDGEYLRIDCPEGTSIHVQNAMYGRKVPSSQMCPPREKEVPAEEYSASGDFEEDLNCEAKTAYECEDQRICRLLVHRRVFGEDPCPNTSKYLTVNYKCTPGDFREESSCARQNLKFRCRQDTVISVYDVIVRENPDCAAATNKTVCNMTSDAIFDDVSSKCHFQERCSYVLPDNACLNHVKIVHTCVPRELLTSELPSSARLSTTTVTSQVTTIDATTVQSTVTTLLHNKGDVTSGPLLTSHAGDRPTVPLQDLDNQTTPTVGDYDETKTLNNITISVFIPNYTTTTNDNDIIKSYNRSEDDDLIIHNEFPMLPEMETATSSNTSLLCANCSLTGVRTQDSFFWSIVNMIAVIEENRDQVIIAMLLGVCAALILTICMLVFPCKITQAKKAREQRPVVQDRRDARTDEFHFPPPEQEDEHENMSLMGSMLQRSISSSTTAHNHVSPNSTQTSPKKTRENGDDKARCGPNSIFAKICCNCCCNNAPWQRRRILKRHRGDVYHVTHRYSSSLDDEEDRGRFHGDPQDTFPVFNRVDDNHSPLPVLEDHVNRTEYPIVTSHQSNFRPISRTTQRHYSTTPEPEQPYRTNHTFLPRQRLPSQRSDNALSVHSTQHHNVIQPVPGPTAPIVTQPAKHIPVRNNHQANPPSHPVSPHAIHTPHVPQPTPHTPTSPTTHATHTTSRHTSQSAYTPAPAVSRVPNHTKRTPITSPTSPRAKHTLVQNQHYNPQTVEHYDNAEAYPTYEQYDNTQQFNTSPYDVRLREHYKQQQQQQQQYMQQQYNTTSHPYYHPNHNGYNEQLVQAVARRTVPSNARTVELAASARTVDLSRNNSLSRNSWIEIRRSSIYDNSLPRNSEMYDYYQQLQEFQQQQQLLEQPLLQQNQQHLLHELPGSRNLNQYYP